MPKQYNRVIVGEKSAYFQECLDGGYIGSHWKFAADLTGDLPDDWHEFNAKYIPICLKALGEISKIAAGLYCGALWTISKGLNMGDTVLMPNGKGQYAIGTIISDYYFVGLEENLPHRRKVKWNPDLIDREQLSDALRRSMSVGGAVCDVSKYAEEIDNILSPKPAIPEDVENAEVFSLEKHLEDFLVTNWEHTELGKSYDIYSDESGQIGQQYPTDTGPMDILAISKDKKTLLVVELKRGRASDHVVGQILRYMSYVQEMLCDEGQSVKGAIIALEDDKKLRRAISMVNGVSFFRYKISFKLVRN